MSVRQTALSLAVVPNTADDIILLATLGEPIMWRNYEPATGQWNVFYTTVTDNQGKTLLPMLIQGKWTFIDVKTTMTIACWHPLMVYPSVQYLESVSNPIEIERPSPPPPRIPWTTIGIVAGAVAATAGLGYYFLVYRKKHQHPYYPQPMAM
jgi:hypothetical protein